MTEQIKQRIKMINMGEVPEGYKKTKVGIVPSEWEVTRLGQIGEFKKGKEVSSSNVIEDGYPAMMYGDIYIKYDTVFNKVDYHIDDETAQKSTPVYKNDLLFTCSGETALEIGKCVCYKGEETIYIGGDILALSPTNENALFLSYQQNSFPLIKQKARLGQGHSVVHIYKNSIEKLAISLPPLPEQEKIAEILTTQDKVIELKQKLINEKKQQKKWLMQQLLTGKIRLKGFSGKWKKVRLGEVLAEGSKKAVDNTAGYRKITIKLNFNGIEFTETKREMADTRPFYIRKKDEIIVGKQNYFNGSVAIVTQEYDGCICSNAIMSFNVISGNLYYIYAYITQPDFMNKYFCLANGTGQKELSEKDFLNFIIKFPPLPEQTVIAEILSTQDKEIELLKKDVEQEKQKKKALMQLLLTGKVRVNI